MSTDNRLRGIVDDRHTIRDPYGSDVNDMKIFTNTLVKKRIPDLYKTTKGFRGHAIQIHQEVYRLSRVENQNGEKVDAAIKEMRFIKRSISKAQQSAIEKDSQNVFTSVLGSFLSNSIDLFARFAPISAQRYNLWISFSHKLGEISSKISKDFEESEPKTEVIQLFPLFSSDQRSNQLIKNAACKCRQLSRG